HRKILGPSGHAYGSSSGLLAARRSGPGNTCLGTITAISGCCWVTVSRSVVIVKIPASAVASSPAMDILNFWHSPHRVGRSCPTVVAGAGPVPRTGYGWPSSRQLAGRFANHGHATDGQMGGRAGDEGPETVVPRDTCRGTEAP